MFRKLFGKKETTPTLSQNLVFKSADVAIDYASKYMNTELVEGHAFAAIVVAEGGFEGGVVRDEQDFQILRLQIPTEGGRITVVGISACAGTNIVIGDFVEWVMLDCEVLSNNYGGVIISVLNPEIETKTGTWRVTKQFETNSDPRSYAKDHFEYYYAIQKGLFNAMR